MKKICFVTTVSYTLDKFVRESADYLYKNGDYDITFICDYDEEFKETLPDYITYIPVSMERGMSLTGGASIKKLYQIFKTEQFDMIQYSTPNASLYASIAAKMAKIPSRLYCQWGMYYAGLAGVKRTLFKSIEKIICVNSTFVEPDSYGNLHFSWNEGLYSPEKSGVVWNGSAIGVDLEKFDLSKKQEWRKEIRNLHKLDQNDKIVGFVGRITKDKGINELLASMKSIFNLIPEARLMLVGEIENEEDLDEQLWSWAKKESRIVFCGTTSQTEKYYAAMDLFVLPSYREGFGMVTVEAEAMQIPVIVTDIPGPTEAIKPDKTGLIVQKKNSEELSQAILYLLQNEEIREKMGEEGRRFAENNFKKETFMEKLFHRREKILSSEKKSPILSEHS